MHALMNNGDLQSTIDRAEQLVHVRRYSEALDAFGAAIRARPSIAGLHHNRGTVLGEIGRIPEAIVAWEHALSLDPTLDASRQSLSILADRMASEAATYSADGRIERAEAALETACRAAPLVATHHSARGDALAALGRDEGGRRS